MRVDPLPFPDQPPVARPQRWCSWCANRAESEIEVRKGSFTMKRGQRETTAHPLRVPVCRTCKQRLETHIDEDG